MIVRLDTHRLQTLDQVREFLDGSEQVDLQPQTRADAYAFVAKTVRRFDYALRGRADKGLLRRFLAKAAGLSRAQITRLLQHHTHCRRRPSARHPTAYSSLIKPSGFPEPSTDVDLARAIVRAGALHRVFHRPEQLPLPHVPSTSVVVVAGRNPPPLSTSIANRLVAVPARPCSHSTPPETCPAGEAPDRDRESHSHDCHVPEGEAADLDPHHPQTLGELRGDLQPRPQPDRTGTCNQEDDGRNADQERGHRHYRSRQRIRDRTARTNVLAREYLHRHANGCQ